MSTTNIIDFAETLRFNKWKNK